MYLGANTGAWITQQNNVAYLNNNYANWLLQCGTNGEPGGQPFASVFGVNIASANANPKSTSSANLQLGVNGASSFRSSFGFSEFMMWDRVLSVAEFYQVAADISERCGSVSADSGMETGRMDEGSR